MIAIYREKKRPDRVFLVDDEEFDLLPKQACKTNSRRYKHFMAAVEIGELTPEQLSFDDGEGGSITQSEPGVFVLNNCFLLRPRPCVLMVQADGFIVSGLAASGIETQAAKVLLELALSYNNVTVRKAYRDWNFDKPAERGAVRGWDDVWLFIAAWLWSAWRGVDRKTRHSLMVQLGYPHDESTLGTMLSRARLVEKNRDSRSITGTSYR